MLSGHSDDFYNYTNEVLINFSSNVWRGGNQELLMEHLHAQLHKISNYPEPDAASLKRLLARRFEIKEDGVIVTNGSTTAFYLVAQAWRGAKSVIPFPSSIEYEEACRMSEHEITHCSGMEELASMSLKGYDMCWIGNPNTPDGRFINKADLLKIISSSKHTIFVVDQAYAAFTTEETLKPADLKANKNLILINSISKAYNIPGLRIGYIVSSAANAKEINRRTIPWSINVPAIEAAKYILIHPAQFTLPIRKWQRETAELIYRLGKIDGIEIIPTSTTFFLVRLKKGTAAALKNYLMANHGILIRDASNFKGLDETYIRLCSQSSDKNAQLVHALKEWLEVQD